ncbi:DNA polymerase III subunit delta' [Lactococcus hodotermopsidis]|uniref:DNA polymerase III subunit delta n=1 Tax=Pseudolactococcus hodotermopsidis TaxID=2709157 RepID=A0A6A0BFM0_9LACT|nr:DNA polymerase III subunit delta' [Lactococcus hodotermopsidis]GFH42627.1 DNA polymerase III subunit delta' [Lactococcus hodotermopsidis]
MNISALQPELYARFSHVLASDRLHHAFLFSGNFGAMEMALWLAQSRFCSNLQSGLPCGSCRECRLVIDNDFTDLHLVKPDGQTIKTAQIRDLLLTFSQSGFEGNRQVVIIDGAEKMHVNAANALLKSIEEPESEIYIFLLTASENMVLETIKSRSQIITFPHQTTIIQNFLAENGVLKTDARLISEIVSSLDEAKTLSEDHSFLESIKQLEKFAKTLEINADEAFLQVMSLSALFKDKYVQALAFKILAILFVKKRQANLAQKVFTAQRYWRSNVNFQASLEKIVL